MLNIFERKSTCNLQTVIRKKHFFILFFYSGHPLFQGVSHDLSNISYYPPSCSSLVSHSVAWPTLINVSAVRRRLTIRELIIVLGCEIRV